MTLKLHNIVSCNWDILVESAKKFVLKHSYDERNSRHPLSSHITSYCEAHNDFFL